MIRGRHRQASPAARVAGPAQAGGARSTNRPPDVGGCNPPCGSRPGTSACRCAPTCTRRLPSSPRMRTMSQPPPTRSRSSQCVTARCTLAMRKPPLSPTLSRLAELLSCVLLICSSLGAGNHIASPMQAEAPAAGAGRPTLHTHRRGRCGRAGRGVGQARGGELADDALVVDRAVAAPSASRCRRPRSAGRYAVGCLRDARGIRARGRRQRGTGRRSTAADGQHGGGGGGGSQYVHLHRVVLLTFIAARPHLAQAAHESLSALGLSGAHEGSITRTRF